MEEERIEIPKLVRREYEKAGCGSFAYAEFKKKEEIDKLNMCVKKAVEIYTKLSQYPSIEDVMAVVEVMPSQKERIKEILENDVKKGEINKLSFRELRGVFEKGKIKEVRYVPIQEIYTMKEIKPYTEKEIIEKIKEI